MALDELHKVGVDVQSKYLDREAARKHEELAQEFWARVEEKLGPEDAETVLTLVRDLQDRSTSVIDEPERLRALERENGELKDRNRELLEELRSR